MANGTVASEASGASKSEEDRRKPMSDDASDDSHPTPEAPTSPTKTPAISREATPPPPPLPPRPKPLPFSGQSPANSLRVPQAGSGDRPPSRPGLQGPATTAVSFHGVQTQMRLVSSQPNSPPTSRQISFAGLHLGTGRVAHDADETASVLSFAPTLEAGGEIESMLGDMLPAKGTKRHRALAEEHLFPPDPDADYSFAQEFDELDDMTSDGLNEAAVIQQWKSKLKHFMILSSAGKPIWSRHGNDQLITSYIGVIQTLISFYQDAKDELKGFTAGDTRFVVTTRGSLMLIAISKLPEGDQQLRNQLEALYMQILSTLTLPVMERMFKARASTDLRRPLQGTEKLLSALADGFTRGSPSTLLSALECLKLRKSHRKVIDNTFLKTRSSQLLYGLIVAGGRLVSVVRPRKQSLHPGDLHLIFNMLFEAGGVKAGDGENWIPLCLPGFNNTGYVYMYVSFLDMERPAEKADEGLSSTFSEEGEVAILLLSTNKESFFELRQMRDDLVQQLLRNGSLSIIQSAVKRGRPSCTDIAPGTAIRHFLYKSKGNVQFYMPSYGAQFDTQILRRRLLTVYSTLHQALHTKPAQAKVYHSTTTTYATIAWSTPVFEFYAIAPASASRVALAQAANRVVQHVRKEEERIFIIGGAVF